MEDEQEEVEAWEEEAAFGCQQEEVGDLGAEAAMEDEKEDLVEEATLEAEQRKLGGEAALENQASYELPAPKESISP